MASSAVPSRGRRDQNAGGRREIVMVIRLFDVIKEVAHAAARRNIDRIFRRFRELSQIDLGEKMQRQVRCAMSRPIEISRQIRQTAEAAANGAVVAAGAMQPDHFLDGLRFISDNALHMDLARKICPSINRPDKRRD